MIKLYWHPRTRAVRIVWLLEELGVPYDLVKVDISDEKSKANPDFRAASPMGKVPALEDGPVKMAETGAMAIYLADKYGDKTLAPGILDEARGDYLYWMLYTPAVIEPAMAEQFGGWEKTRFSHGWGDFELMISTIENRLKGRDWLLGHFTAADTIVGSSVNFMKMFGILPQSKILEGYIERCLERPAFERALAKEA